jgi:hypothetical protein
MSLNSLEYFLKCMQQFQRQMLGRDVAEDGTQELDPILRFFSTFPALVKSPARPNATRVGNMRKILNDLISNNSR